ncbi:hypothetical protein Lfu02_63370 [Longispora fulva]|uniref:Uncharacterized protein n=1 Tax=Longispora fulva TaxID=619741 RepID=A0A8J7GAG0_9ACTN|nr:hypothetical protein [Longispora fulva]MBG6134754.1 hypothetical protein [Longispora fulva]GIG61965.1 hypothetical protein Lfu02_63370 [Longispora fulva]
MPEPEQPRTSTAPLGSHRSAERLSERTGLRVKPSDIDDLAAAGVLVPTGEFKGNPIFRLNDLDGVSKEEIAAVVERRQSWRAASKSASGALETLGWNKEDFQRITAERGITAGPGGRYALSDIEALAADPLLVAQLAADRLLTLDQAATHLGVRRLDLDYCLAAGWLSPHELRRTAAGRHRAATVTVPMFRTADVDALLDVYGVDWAQVRTTPPGTVSPLAEWTRIPAERAAVIHAFCADLEDYYRVEVRALWRADGDIWEVEWIRDRAGEPTVEQVTRNVQQHSVHAYWTDMELRAL